MREIGACGCCVDDDLHFTDFLVDPGHCHGQHYPKIFTTSNHLFEVTNELDSIKLDAEKATMFHHILAYLFFPCKRPGSVQYLESYCIPTRHPDEDDYKKLCCAVF